MDLSVVLAAHDEESTIDGLVTRLTMVLETLGRKWEIIFVDDGSSDRTWPRIRAAATHNASVRGLRLSRNFGHQAALSAGISSARGDYVITMDADLQHPPEAIPALLAKAEEGYDVVYGIRRTREGETRLKVTLSSLFYRALNKLTQIDLPEGAADFRLMTRRVVDALIAMPERHRFLRGMTRWLGYAQTGVEYSSTARQTGASKYTMRQMISFALDAIVSFSAVPLRLSSALGFMASLLGAIYLVYVLLSKFILDNAIPGWTSVVVLLLILGGAQLVCLGIIGQYLGRMFDEQKSRPLFLIDEDTQQSLNTSPSPDIDVPAAR
jgi:glycosyltransferase involved in cell wall biosynthesis